MAKKKTQWWSGLIGQRNLILLPFKLVWLLFEPKSCDVRKTPFKKNWFTFNDGEKVLAVCQNATKR